MPSLNRRAKGFSSTQARPAAGFRSPHGAGMGGAGASPEHPTPHVSQWKGERQCQHLWEVVQFTKHLSHPLSHLSITLPLVGGGVLHCVGVRINLF